VSVEAILWALNLAPVPADRGGQPSSACKFVLVGLANHAWPDGIGAFPSVATLVRYTGLSERTVRTYLDRLEADSIIRPCDPGIVAARIKRADRRPQGWDLDLGMVRDDLAEFDVMNTRAGHRPRPRQQAAGRSACSSPPSGTAGG
jgi:Helix-turn-helix domain